jgi:V8-like Glu-specific endopeptidase
MSLHRFTARRRKLSVLVGGLAVVVFAIAVSAAGKVTPAVGSSAAGLQSYARSAVITPARSTTVEPNGLMIHHLTQSPAQVRAYWTPARMAAAKSVDVMTRSGTPPAVAPLNPTGAPASAPSWAPSNLADAVSGTAPQQAPATATPQTQCANCFIPYTRYYYFAKYRTYPVSTVGKLFFTNDGGNYVCSASVIFTDTLDTAGHCVANTDGTHQWDSSALFCPSYNAGVNPAVGCWAANYFAAWNQWITDGSFEWDFGGVNTSTCGSVWCTDVANRTGYLGVAWNQGEDQNFTAFGYPQASPFDGNYIVTCQSEFGYETSEGNNDGGPNSIAIGCDMTGGSSGGPWILGFGGGNWVNGHNDWKWNSLPQAMNSPYVDTRDCQVWSAAGRSDITC